MRIWWQQSGERFVWERVVLDRGEFNQQVI